MLILQKLSRLFSGTCSARALARSIKQDNSRLQHDIQRSRSSLLAASISHLNTSKHVAPNVKSHDGDERLPAASRSGLYARRLRS